MRLLKPWRRIRPIDFNRTMNSQWRCGAHAVSISSITTRNNRLPKANRTRRQKAGGVASAARKEGYMRIEPLPSNPDLPVYEDQAWKLVRGFRHADAETMQ